MSSWRGIILVPGLFYRFQLVVQNQLTEKCPAMKRSLLSVEPLVERVEQFIGSPLPLYLSLNGVLIWQNLIRRVVAIRKCARMVRGGGGSEL